MNFVTVSLPSVQPEKKPILVSVEIMMLAGTGSSAYPLHLMFSSCGHVGRTFSFQNDGL